MPLVRRSCMAMCAVAIVAATAACGGGVEEEAEVVAPEVGLGTERVGVAGGEIGPDIEDVVENPVAYAGQTVTLSGEVEETYAPGRAFSITGSGVIAENQILVLTRSNQAVEEDQTVRATGMVRAYTTADLTKWESELGWDFTPELEAELAEVKAVLVADTVMRTQTEP